MLGGVVLVAFTRRLEGLVLLGLLAFVRWLAANRAAWRAPRRFGFANSVTALRIALVVWVAWLSPGPLIPWGGWLVLVIFGLDALDGWWARRTGTATKFGAAFDQEADAFMVAVVTGALVQADLAPGWVLIVGGLRYGYVLVVSGLQLHGEVPRNALARNAFGILVCTFIGVMVWPCWLTAGAVQLASLLIIGSFAHSLWWSWRGPVGERRE